MTAAVDLVVSEFVIVAVICVLLMRYYKSPMVTLDVSIAVYLSWVLGLAGVLFLPYDISLAVVNNTTSHTLQIVWKFVYWSTFVLAWIVLPIQMEYHSSGHFTVLEKLKDSVIKNLVAGVIAIVLGLLYIIYMVFSGGSSLSQVIGFLMALGNTYGVLLIILLMGSGLVQLPKRLWQISNIKEELQRLHISACAVESAYQEARYELEDCEYEINRALEYASKPSSYVSEDVRVFLDQLKTNMTGFEFNGRSSTRKNVVLSNNDTILLTKQAVVDLRARLLCAQVRVRASERRWHTLLRHSKQYNEIIEGTAWSESSGNWSEMPTEVSYAKSSGGTSSLSFFDKFMLSFHQKFVQVSRVVHYFWMTWCHKWVFRVLSILCGIASAFILWGELVMASNLQSPMGYMMGAYDSSANNKGRFTWMHTMALLYLSYISICTYWSLFRLNLGWQYTLQGPQLSPHTSLIFNGQYFSRLQFAMGYNFLLILNVSSTSKTAFNELMSNIELIPVFGTSFTVYMPLVMVLIALATIFNVFSRIVKIIGFEMDDIDSGDWFCNKSSLTQEEKEQLETGRTLVASELRQLNNPSRSKEMSSKSSKSSSTSGNNSITGSISLTGFDPLKSFGFGRSKLVEPLRGSQDNENTAHDYDGHDSEKNRLGSRNNDGQKMSEMKLGSSVTTSNPTPMDAISGAWGAITNFVSNKSWIPLNKEENKSDTTPSPMSSSNPLWIKRDNSSSAATSFGGSSPRQFSFNDDNTYTGRYNNI